MRKLVVWVVCVIAALGCCLASAEDFSALETPVLSMPLQGTEASVNKKMAFAPSAPKDTVIVAGNIVAMKADSLTMLLEMPPAYLCITQDFDVSARGYAMLNDPEGMQAAMLANDIHFLLLDQYMDTVTYLYTSSPDLLSFKIGSLDELSETDFTAAAKKIASGNGMVYAGSKETKTARWIHLTGGSDLYLTIHKGNYIVYFCEGATAEDAETVLDNLGLYD